MYGTGLDINVNTSENNTPNWVTKVGIGYYSGNHDYPYVILGAGTSEKGDGKGCVYKLGNGLWIGDACIVEAGGNYAGGESSASDISSSYNKATGIFVDLSKGKIYQYIKGVPSEIGSGGKFG